MSSPAEKALREMGLPTGDTRTNDSEGRFRDGGWFRFEIPSVEGPGVFQAVVEESKKLDVPIHRISEGSGIQLMTDSEILEMARIGAKEHIEVSLFLGPRAGFEPSAMHLAQNGGVIRPRLRGMDAVRAALDDALRAYSLGIRSVLVADEGMLWLHKELRDKGLWPSDLKVKVSVMMGASNPLSIGLLAGFGVATYNCPTDLTIEQLATIRSFTSVPLDIYVESPDDVGGFVRYGEIEGFVRYVAPVYLKFGVRNAPNIYPSGFHWEETAIRLGRERVRRARIAWEAIHRLGLEKRMSPLPCTAEDLAVPHIVGG